VSKDGVGGGEKTVESKEILKRDKKIKVKLKRCGPSPGGFL